MMIRSRIRSIERRFPGRCSKPTWRQAAEEVERLEAKGQAYLHVFEVLSDEDLCRIITNGGRDTMSAEELEMIIASGEVNRDGKKEENSVPH